MSTPEQFDNILMAVNQAYPVVPPFDRINFPSGTQYIPAWLDAGNSEEKIVKGLLAGLDALRLGGKGPDPNGQWMGLRHDAYTGESNEQDLLNGYFLQGAPLPTQKQFWDRVYTSAAPTPIGPTPAEQLATANAKLNAIKAIANS